MSILSRLVAVLPYRVQVIQNETLKPSSHPYGGLFLKNKTNFIRNTIKTISIKFYNLTNISISFRLRSTL